MSICYAVFYVFLNNVQSYGYGSTLIYVDEPVTPDNWADFCKLVEKQVTKGSPEVTQLVIQNFKVIESNLLELFEKEFGHWNSGNSDELEIAYKAFKQFLEDRTAKM